MSDVLELPSDNEAKRKTFLSGLIVRIFEYLISISNESKAVVRIYCTVERPNIITNVHVGLIYNQLKNCVLANDRTVALVLCYFIRVIRAGNTDSLWVLFRTADDKEQTRTFYELIDEIIRVEEQYMYSFAITDIPTYKLNNKNVDLTVSCPLNEADIWSQARIKTAVLGLC